ncbi:MAG: hypothetical protein BWY63_03643 [Chloroflexi bacterium ADurb.Bin360]|nr:MAG: hypothetical protein BWY63_03643 [Chloroflexi bacterium ADurb.Bin360]
MEMFIEAHKRATLGMLLRRELRGNEPLSYNGAVAAAGEMPGIVFQAAALATLAADEYITDGQGEMPCALTDKGRTRALQLEKELHVLCEKKDVECPCLKCAPVLKGEEDESYD